MDLICRPVMWKHHQAVDQTEKNALKYKVEPLPDGIFGSIVRDGDKWYYEITIGGAQPVVSDRQFRSLEEAKTGVAEWLSNHPVRARLPH